MILHRRKIAAMMLAFLAEFSYGHEDTRINLENGKLIGLPEQYQPASFDRFRLELSIGSKSIVFPTCIRKYFEEVEDHDLEIMASWYHERSSLPEYIGFEISSAQYQYKYNLLFNLNTLQPLWFQLWTLKNGMRLHDIEIDEHCLTAARAATK